jgi:phage gpG-like protein
MAGIQVRVIPIRGGSAAAVRKLRELTRKVRDPSPANREVSRWLFRWVNENFRSEGGKVGKWKPFKHGGRKMPDGSIDASAKLLQDTGRLRASFSPFYGRTIAGIGSDLQYSVTHELGIPHRNIPIRRMLPLASDTEVTNNIIQIYNVYIRRALND